MSEKQTKETITFVLSYTMTISILLWVKKNNYNKEVKKKKERNDGKRSLFFISLSADCHKGHGNSMNKLKIVIQSFTII